MALGTRPRKEAEEEERARKIDAAVKAVAIKPEDVSDDEVPEEEREMPMYFAEPQQLLDIFTALEESNLFLIQNSQETEEALEELKAKFFDTRGRMDTETAGLKVQIDSLKGSIEVEEAKGQGLNARAGRNTGVQHQEDTLNELNRKVAETYRAIFSEGDATLSTLQMLTNIEAKLEELLSTIDSMPKDEVEAEEKKKEKERRQRAREIKQAAAAAAQEERIQRSIRRAQQPVVKRTGSPSCSARSRRSGRRRSSTRAW